MDRDANGKDRSRNVLHIAHKLLIKSTLYSTATRPISIRLIDKRKAEGSPDEKISLPSIKSSPPAPNPQRQVTPRATTGGTPATQWLLYAGEP
ncbi:hypothetical protein CEN39_22920, partial [Fischerella thermalis CCMEE 5201]